MSRRAVLTITGWLVAAALSAGTVPAALAQSAECGKAREVAGQALDEATYNQLNLVYEKVGDERYDEAYADLQRMLGRAGRDEYLQAILHQALAQVEWSREKYDPALTHFEKAVALDTLPNEAHFALMYQIAQLYFMKERYQEALDRLDLWFCTAPPGKITAAAWVLKASIHASIPDYRAALVAIDRAIGMDKDPKESWYQLKLAAQFELEEFAPAAETLEAIISRWPDKKTYWIQLAQTRVNLKEEAKALSVLALAHRRKLLDTQSDLLFLSSLYSNAGIPYKAADVLQKGIESGIVEASERNWTMTAENWYAAEEMDQSLAAFEKAGAAASGGDVDLRRAYILIDMERWQPAREALDAALTKGGLDEPRTGEAYLLRGMAMFNLGEFDQASEDWGRATRYPRTRDAAEQWINHLQEERRRQAS